MTTGGFVYGGSTQVIGSVGVLPLPPPPVESQDPFCGGHLSGGPLVIWGQGGNVMILLVTWPLPSVTSTVECEMGTLGDGLKAPD